MLNSRCEKNQIHIRSIRSIVPQETYRFAMIKRIERTGALRGSEPRVRFLCPFPSKIPKR